MVSYCGYLGKLFWPADLAVLYPHPGHSPLWQVALAGGLLLGISALVLALHRRHPYLLMGWLWYCGTLVPMSGAVAIGIQSTADRWTYVSSLGVLILLIWGACEIANRQSRNPPLVGGWRGGAPLAGHDAATAWLLEGQ